MIRGWPVWGLFTVLLFGVPIHEFDLRIGKAASADDDLQAFVGLVGLGELSTEWGKDNRKGVVGSCYSLVLVSERRRKAAEILGLRLRITGCRDRKS